jgi:hypothetical protein
MATKLTKTPRANRLRKTFLSRGVVWRAALLFLTLVGTVSIIYGRALPIAEKVTGSAAGLLVQHAGPQDPREAMEAARAELSSSLLKASALRSYAIAAEQMGDEKEAREAFALSSALGWRDTPTQVRLFQKAIRLGDAPSAVLLADGLARRNQALELTIPFLASAALIPETRGYVLERLLHEPGWRFRFFATLRQGQELGEIASFVREYAASGGKMAAEEINPILRTFADRGDYAEARSLLETLEPATAQSLIFDGDFSSSPATGREGAAHPFEWEMISGGSVNSFVGTPPWSSADRALAVQWRGDVNTSFAAQTLSLEPGDHLLKISLAAVRQGNIDAFAIEFRCLPGGAGTRPAPISLQKGDPWSVASFRLDVPSSNCSAQRLALIVDSQTAGEHSLWVDRVEIAESDAAKKQTRGATSN